MKRIFYSLILLVGLCGCSSTENAYDELPAPIAKFISEYWPNPDIDSYTQPEADEYVVIIKSGPSLTFDADYKWTDVNGLGMPLQEMFLYDQLPTNLYDYLSEGSNLDDVFRVVRDSSKYTLTLLDTVIEYDMATGQITQT